MKTSPEIRFFAHCRTCAPQRPANQSMSEWARIDAGLTEQGLLLWCKRCRKNIAVFTPETLTEALQGAHCACCPGGVHVN